MGRPKAADPIDQARRLREARAMIKESGEAMPGMARELRRSACETIDEVIGELATPLRVRKAALAEKQATMAAAGMRRQRHTG